MKFLKELKIFILAFLNFYKYRVKSRELVDYYNTPISHGTLVEYKGNNFTVCSNVNDEYTIYRSTSDELIQGVKRSSLIIA